MIMALETIFLLEVAPDTDSGYRNMKKIIAVFTTFVLVCVSSLAFSEETVASDDIEQQNVASQGYGACTHKGCQCKSFSQRPGYYQCWCGHQRNVHR